MKFKLPAFLCVMAASCVIGLPGHSSAQEIKIAVVDMQDALNRYFKTEVEVEKINAMAEEKRKSLDERQVGYQQMTTKATELDALVRDTARSEDSRKKAMEELQQLIQERTARGREIAQAQETASREIMAARSEMEANLVAEIKAGVDSIVAAQALDLVFDKSFLPKANKAILHTSDRVIDITEELVTNLNASKPAQ